MIIMIISLELIELPLPSNPCVEQSNVTILVVKWSPPFLWPGYAIGSYNISIINNTDRSVTVYFTTPSNFNNSIESFPFEIIAPSYAQCTKLTFEITPSNAPDLVNQTRRVNGTLRSCK